MAIIRGWRLLFLKCFLSITVPRSRSSVSGSRSSAICELLHWVALPCPGQEWAHSKLFTRACMPSHVPKLLWLSFSRAGICWADSSQSY